MHGVRVLQDGNLRLTPLATWSRRTKLSRMISLRLRALALASAALSILSCGSSNTDTAPSPAPTSDAAADAAIDAAVIVNHSTPATTPIGDGGDDVGSAMDATASDGETDAGPSTPQTFIRVADWTPDAPSAGFDLCLAPAGTTTGSGPCSRRCSPRDRSGRAAPTACSFPAVTKYFGVAPGQYDIQLVASGATDCTTGLLAETDLPALAVNAHTTFATVGDVNPRGNDTGLKIAAFFDDVTVSNGQAAAAGHQRDPVGGLPRRRHRIADGAKLRRALHERRVRRRGGDPRGRGTLGITGYLSMAPATNAQFSAHATGTETTDTATATHVSLGAGPPPPWPWSTARTTASRLSSSFAPTTPRPPTSRRPAWSTHSDVRSPGARRRRPRRVLELANGGW